MAKRNAKEKRLGVLIDRQWFIECNMKSPFWELQDQLRDPKRKRLLLWATHCDSWNGDFVEITLYPKVFHGMWVKLFVPRNRVHGIIELESAEGATNVGFAVAGELQGSKKQPAAKLSSLKSRPSG